MRDTHHTEARTGALAGGGGDAAFDAHHCVPTSRPVVAPARLGGGLLRGAADNQREDARTWLRSQERCPVCTPIVDGVDVVHVQRQWRKSTGAGERGVGGKESVTGQRRRGERLE